MSERPSFTAFWLGYVPSGIDNRPPLPATPPRVDVLTLAFGNLYPGNSTCLSFLQKSHSEDAIKAGIAALRTSAPNTKILMSIIGTPHPPVGWNDGITDPEAFGGWCAGLAESWGLDGFDIDNEDLDTFPGAPFVATVKAMRAAMPDKILTLDTYIFERDSTVIGQLADDLTSINTMAYFLGYDDQVALFEQYARAIAPEKISIGVAASKVGPPNQGTSLDDVKRLCAWNPSGGRKRGMMLWSLTSDVEVETGEPDGAYTKAIVEGLS